MLLQEIYAREAMQEAGISGTLEIVHAEQPKTIVNGKDYGLLFPRRIFKSQPKDIEMLFIGKHTPQREAFLRQFPEATIIYTDNGRNDSIKGYDSQYWDMMQRAKYVLCPDGDFVWTYRFFEAIACGAIPIVQTWCTLYDKYYFMFDIDDFENNVYWDIYWWPEWNLEIIKPSHTL